MSAERVGDPPSPETPSTVVELAGKLHELRRWAGQPSLRRLRKLGGIHRTADGTAEVAALPESTTSYVLRGDRPASAAFVRAFVLACLRARHRDPAEVTDLLERWHEAWLAATGHATVRTSAEPVPETAPAARDPGTAPATPVPRQLPADVAGFTGRAAELTALGKLPGTGQVAAPALAVVAVITGTAGVGKTALAVHAAHRIADQFPDGQLFVDLRGFTTGTSPVEPADALHRMLHMLDVPGARIPVELDDRAAVWRSALAGRRMLILLDNAATAEQVRPLLPGEPGCLVMITSRRCLTALETSHLVRLDLLPRPDAIALFERAAGQPHRTDAGEPAAEAVELCGRLPLAIRIAAARLRSHPAWSLTDLIARLRDQDHRLVELADETGTRSVASAIEMSYQLLLADQQRLYRQLGLHPGPDIDRYGAAALLDSGVERAHRLLDSLLEAHLLQESAAGRYAFHDLVRAHALATSDPPAGWRRRPSNGLHRGRRAAGTRLLDYYRHTTSKAMDVAYPYERGRRPRVRPARTPAPELPDPAAALGWLDTELPNLLALARYAADHGWPEHTGQLSALLHRHLRTRGHYPEAEALHRLALATGHRSGQLDALAGLGWIHLMRGDNQPAHRTFQLALKLAHGNGHRSAELNALVGLGWLEAGQGWYERALDGFQRALALARTTDDRPGQLDALVGLGRVHQMQGRYQPAQEALAAALEIARATGNAPGELNALIGLGRVRRLRGHHERAIDAFHQALRIAHATGDRVGELNALRGLGSIHLVRCRFEPALEALDAALEIARSIGHRGGEVGALIGLGHVHRRRTRPAQAAESYLAALDVAREVSDRNWQFEALHGLGRVHDATGRPDSARGHYRQALALATELGQPSDQARAHDGLAHTYCALRQPQQARQHWQRSLTILTDLGTEHTDDEETSVPAIRAHLARLDD